MVGVPLVEDFDADQQFGIGPAAPGDDLFGDGHIQRDVLDDLAALLVPDEGAVVVDGRGVEIEGVVVRADGARRAGGGQDDLDARGDGRFDGGVRLGGDGFARRQKRAIEVDGHHADRRPGGGRRAGAWGPL